MYDFRCVASLQFFLFSPSLIQNVSSKKVISLFRVIIIFWQYFDWKGRHLVGRPLLIRFFIAENWRRQIHERKSYIWYWKIRARFNYLNHNYWWNNGLSGIVTYTRSGVDKIIILKKLSQEGRRNRSMLTYYMDV